MFEDSACPVQHSPIVLGARAQGSKAMCGPEGTFRLAVPRRGHVLSTVVEIYGKPIREAVAILEDALAKTQCSGVRAALLVPRHEQPEARFARSDAEMAAWAVVSMWVVGIAVRALRVDASLSEAERWFLGSSAQLTRLVFASAISRAEAVLRADAEASAYFELLPYILDPHGPGSRLSVRRDPATRPARKRRRAEGVFYTPADVAEYMAGTCLAGISDGILPSIFDPACGTGVFLRVALQEVRRRHPDVDAFSLASKCMFGTDVDPWPLDATAFVLFADVWCELNGKDAAPAEVWQQLRRNFACVDTLRIDPVDVVPETARTPQQDGRVSISRLFPALVRGPMVILGNPPYADLGPRADLSELGRIYDTLAPKPEPHAEVYLPFIEQMIRLADRETCAGALVLPLSLACNVGRQFFKTRKLISKTRGQWRFAFFDREPHALFGEDVKTRNAVLLWSRTPSDTHAALSTGPLRKWRGDSRAAMFRSLRFTAIDCDIRGGVPKVDGTSQAAALRTLSERCGQLEQVAQSIGRVALAEIANADQRTVFVGATAYNFLNVFLRPGLGVVPHGRMLSEHPLHFVRCASEAQALAVFAILSSHLTYWWWHTHGDGFHVSRRFIAELPFGLEDLTDEVIGALSRHGADLWSAIRAKPIVSLNRGRTSLAYTPKGHDEVRRRSDQVLADAAGLEETFIDELQQFTAHTVSATLRTYNDTVTDEKETA